MWNDIIIYLHQNNNSYDEITNVTAQMSHCNN